MNRTLEWLRALPPEDLLARTLEGEAGGEGELGMLAAGAVIANRRRGGGDWADVILAPGQFSLYNGVTGHAGGAGANAVWTRPPSETARAVAARIVAGDYADPTGGATHYYNPEAADPVWARGKEGRNIGRHRFLRADDRGGRSMQRDDGQTPQRPLPRGQTASEPSPWQQVTDVMARRGEEEQRVGSRLSPLVAMLLAGGANLPRIAKGRDIDPNAGGDYVAGLEQRRAANATAAWLDRQGVPQLAEGVRTGAISGKDALDILRQGGQREKGVVVDKRIVDPVTGRVIYEPEPGTAGALDKEVMTAANALRDDIRAEMSTVQLVTDGARTIETLYQNPGAVSDYALAVAFAKIVDPGSVAREGEVAAVQSSGAMFPQYLQSLKNAVSGTGSMNPAMRQEIAALAARFANQQIQKGQERLQHWQGVAERNGIPFELLWSGGELAPVQMPGGGGGGGGAGDPGSRTTPGLPQGFDPSKIIVEE